MTNEYFIGTSDTYRPILELELTKNVVKIALKEVKISFKKNKTT